MVQQQQLRRGSTRRVLAGLAYPTRKRPGGYFSTEYDIDVAFGDLLNTLLTPKGRRWMRRGFGSRLHELIGQPNDLILKGQAENIVRQEAAAFCPHIDILQVVVTTYQNSGVGPALKISISIALRDTNQQDTRTFVVTQFPVLGDLAERFA